MRRPFLKAQQFVSALALGKHQPPPPSDGQPGRPAAVQQRYELLVNKQVNCLIGTAANTGMKGRSFLIGWRTRRSSGIWHSRGSAPRRPALLFVSSARWSPETSACWRQPHFLFSKHFGGFEDVEEMRGCTLINLALAEEITALWESLLGGLSSASAGTLYEPREVH